MLTLNCCNKYYVVVFCSSDEQGPFFRSCAAESLREWKSRHSGLLSPATEVEKQSKQSSPDSALPPSTATSDSVNSSGRGW